MKNILSRSYCIFVLALFAGCSKSNSDNSGSQKVVSIEGNISGTNTITPVIFTARATDTTLNILKVTLAGGFPAVQDIHITLDTDSLLVVNYNAANSTNLAIPNSGDYHIISKTITIPKGQSTGYVQFRIVPSNFIGKKFALGFRIVHVDGGYNIAGAGKNEGLAVFRTTASFEGTYSITGIQYDYPGPVVSYNYPDPIPTGYISTTAIPNPKLVTAPAANIALVDFADLGFFTEQYVVTVPSGLSGPTDFPVQTFFTAAMVVDVSNLHVLVHTYNPNLQTFHFVIVYTNRLTTTNHAHILFETMVKQ